MTGLRGRLRLLPLALLAAAGCASQAARSPGSVTLTFPAWWLGEERVVTENSIRQFTEETQIAVKLITVREGGPEGLGQILELLKNVSTPPDIYQIDVIWTGIVSEYLIDLKPYLAQESDEHLAGIIQNNTVDGRLVGMPFVSDVGLLFYRTDLLRQYGFDAPPTNWDELEKMAATIQAGERAKGRPRFWGFVWQGADYEGLTCNALEWQMSHGGGHIIEPDGRITVNNPKAARALKRAARWVGTISPPGVIAYREEDARNLWESGNAAFMRNWPFAYGMGQLADSPVRGRFDVTTLPSGGVRHANVLGGWQLGVSRNSTHRREAIEFVRYMTSRQVQAKRAIAISSIPTIPALLDDPRVLQANPYYGRLKDVMLGGAVARPSVVTGKSYNDVSNAYSSSVHSVLTRKASAEQALAELQARLASLTGLATGPP